MQKCQAQPTLIRVAAAVSATGAVPGARYAYSPATPEMLAKVARIEAV